MDAKYVALALFGLVSYQAGADPEGTAQGVGSFFTSTNAVVRQTPALFNGVGDPATPAQPAPGYSVIDLPDGRKVTVPAGYRVVPTGS